MTSNERKHWKLFRNPEGHSWVGECQHDAQWSATVPASDDPRWIPGVPALCDVEIITLSPFQPSGRLGVCVERRESKPLSRYPNHPAFAGCKAWMLVDAIDWLPIVQ